MSDKSDQDDNEKVDIHDHWWSIILLPVDVVKLVYAVVTGKIRPSDLS